MKEEIQNWFKKGQPYQEGVALYNKYGRNHTLKKKFAKKENAMFREKLAYKLAELAGISQTPVKKKSNPSQSNRKQLPGKQPKATPNTLPLGKIFLLK
jgi:hypothetical protein